jgi:hypothetical protein
MSTIGPETEHDLTHIEALLNDVRDALEDADIDRAEEALGDIDEYLATIRARLVARRDN